MAISKKIAVAVTLAAATQANAGTAVASEQNAANPIRKVVNMLQKMQAKVSAEGEKKQAMYDKYMCYCENADTTLGQSISNAQTKIPQVESSINESTARKAQLEKELKDNQVSRVEAKDTIAKSTALREKEAKVFSAKEAELKTNIGALNKAIPAIEKGMSGAFLQTQAASVLRQISINVDMIPADRDLLASFLSEGNNYAPKSGEITGILKTLKDNMEKDLASATSDENSAISSFDSLVASKNKEIQALTKGIESKTMRIGELGVQIAQLKNDLEDTQEGLAQDQQFYADLGKNCDLKKKEWAAYKEVQAQEMVALADTIKILNSDDSLELFKKTLPSASSSFVQVKVSSRAQTQHILSVLKAGHKNADPRLDFIEMALKGKKLGFGKIIKLIDNLVVELKAEQGVDESKKSYCETEFDKAEDKKKELEQDISDLEKAIEDGTESISSLAAEIAALEDGIKKLDKQVSEATEQRKEEHDDYVETLAQNNAAKDVLAFAKNRLNKFYNPKMYKAPPAREVAMLEQPKAPEADLSYKKSGQESNGVIAMIDLLVADIDKENQEMEVDEKDGQKDYERFMSDSSSKRATDSKAITDKEGAKAETESELQANKEAKRSKNLAAMETAKFIAGLHEECDWLLQNFDARKEARSGEIEALGKAKAVLNGADYSFLETGVAAGNLRGIRKIA